MKLFKQISMFFFIGLLFVSAGLAAQTGQGMSLRAGLAAQTVKDLSQAMVGRGGAVKNENPVDLHITVDTIRKVSPQDRQVVFSSFDYLKKQNALGFKVKPMILFGGMEFDASNIHAIPPLSGVVSPGKRTYYFVARVIGSGGSKLGNFRRGAESQLKRIIASFRGPKMKYGFLGAGSVYKPHVTLMTMQNSANHQTDIAELQRTFANFSRQLNTNKTYRIVEFNLSERLQGLANKFNVVQRYALKLPIVLAKKKPVKSASKKVPLKKAKPPKKVKPKKAKAPKKAKPKPKKIKASKKKKIKSKKSKKKSKK